jgi:ATP-dependent Lhr-like helicase
VSNTERIAATAGQLLARHGVLTREALAAEGIVGGFSAIYPALKAMDDAGRVRRGYFVSGLGATQFALPGALDLLRALRDPDAEPAAVVMAATDPANPYGSSLPWPAPALSRVVGALVVVVDGAMAVHVARGGRELTVALPADEPFRSRMARAAAQALVAYARADRARSRPTLVTAIDDRPAPEHPFAAFLEEAGFVRAGAALHIPRRVLDAVEEADPGGWEEPEAGVADVDDEADDA